MDATILDIGHRAFRIESNNAKASQKIADFLVSIGANIFRWKLDKLKADIIHPDGLTLRVCIRFHASLCNEETVVDAMRYSGDALLFQLVYQMMRRSVMQTNVKAECLYTGQICPRVHLSHIGEPSEQPPELNLDAMAQKRKLQELSA